MQATNSLFVKLGLAALSIGVVAGGLTGTAEARRISPSYAAHAKVTRDFRTLDKNNNGILTRADFVTYSKRLYWNGRSWKRKVVVINNRKFARLRAKADLNRDRRITLAEYKRAMLPTRVVRPRPIRPVIVKPIYRPKKVVYKPKRHVAIVKPRKKVIHTKVVVRDHRSKKKYPVRNKR